MRMRKILDEVTARTRHDGTYRCGFKFATGIDPGEYRVRMFYRYNGLNDLTSATGRGLYAVSDNPCDAISYDDWNGMYRKPLYLYVKKGHDSSFNVEVDCAFSSDTNEHNIDIFDQDGRGVWLSGESVINGTFDERGFPINLLLERRVATVGIDFAEYSPDSHRVTVHTLVPHNFNDGDAISISGFPRTDHSCGVNGERYNGTYSISVLDDMTFSYATVFFNGIAGPCYKYDNCGLAVCTKWIVCEYLVDKEIIPSMREAVVMWRGHTFKEGDRVTLCDDNGPAIHNALVTVVSPNAFVCSSSDITLESRLTSIVYAPRTPISDVPANYTLTDAHQEPVKPASPAKKALKASAKDNSFDPTVVNNASQSENGSVQVYPYSYAVFDLDNPASGNVMQGCSMDISTERFGVATFNPPAIKEYHSGNTFIVTLTVTGSTEVETEMYMTQLTDPSWGFSSDARGVWSKVSKVPISDVAVIKSDAGADEQTCNYGDGKTFQFTVGPAVGDIWCAAGKPVSLAFFLHGRDGSRVTVDASAGKFSICMSNGGTPPSIPIPVKIMPVLATPGDTVTVYSLNSQTFDALVGNLRVQFDGESDPDKWTRVMTNSGMSLTFTVPEGISGKTTMVVKEKPADNPDWTAAVSRTEKTTLDVYAPAPRIVKLNDRMTAGEVSSGASGSAIYNRDLGYKNFTEITDENSLIQNLYSCILTRRGERLFNPEFGTSIEERIFSLRTGSSGNEILKECLAAIERYEPRIRLVYEHCHVTDMGSNGMYLTLGVSLPSGEVEKVSIPFRNRGRLV